MIDLIQDALQAAAQSMLEKVSRTVVDAVSRKTKEETKIFHHKAIFEPLVTADSIEKHIGEMRHWCENIHHHGMLKAAELDSVFVSLQLNSDLRKHRLGKATDTCLFSASKVLQSSNNIILTGDLGAGKTTLLKQYAIEVWSSDAKDNLIIFRFRDFREGDSVFSKLCELIKIEFEG